MQKLTITQCNDFFAKRCPVCKGVKRIKTDEGWSACRCQYTATVRYRLEQFEVTPPELKNKTWDDFSGLLAGAKTDVKNTDLLKLSQASWLKAKQECLTYCFGQPDPSLVNDRAKHLIIHLRYNEGRNVVISGASGTGKTLLAVLIIKEVIHACNLHKLRLSFKCVKSSILQNAARWTGDKSIDNAFLEELAEIDFLVIDDIDTRDIGHNTPPDMIAMDVLFGKRLSEYKPTIILCSDSFASMVSGSNSGARYHDNIRRQWGDEFLRLITRPGTFRISLKKEKTQFDHADDILQSQVRQIAERVEAERFYDR